MKNEKFEKFISPLRNTIKKTNETILNFYFNTFPIAKNFLKKPLIKENSFIVWEPCTKSHSEVVPGFVKYLSDLNYHVSILVEPDRIKEGLFSRFNLQNITINKLKSKDIKLFFKYGDLSKIKGVLVTTAGKLCDNIHYEDAYKNFNSTLDKKRLYLVEHDIKEAVDNNTLKENIITLRKMDYKNAKTTEINPHYFGDIKITPKNEDIINFVTIGVLKDRKKNNSTIIDAVLKLHQKNIKNFKVTVIGKGKMNEIPSEVKQYFDLKGRLPFDKMYDEIEKADFILTSYDEKHKRYITTGTSGNFQLIYGFLKPCLIIENYAKINGFDNDNSIIYNKVDEYNLAMEKGINLNQEEYKKLQQNLKKYTETLYNSSLNNFKGLLDEQ